MIPLVDTNDVIRVVTSSTADVDYVATFADRTSTPPPTPSFQTTTTNTATTTTIVSSPSASTTRDVDGIYIRNRHASASNDIQVELYNGTTAYQMIKATLLAGESLHYDDGVGWRVFDSLGVPKATLDTLMPTVGTTLTTVVLAADVTNNNAVANTIADVTALSFAVTSGVRYYFRAVIHYTAAATTTGSRWSINGPAAPTELRFKSEYSLTTTSQTINEGLSAYDTPAASNATSAATGSNIAIVEGFITPSANGTVIVRFASEVASSAIVAKAGSILQYQAV